MASPRKFFMGSATLQVILFLLFVSLGVYATVWSLTLGTSKVFTGQVLDNIKATDSATAGLPNMGSMPTSTPSQVREAVPLITSVEAFSVAGLCSALWLPQLLILMNGLFSDERQRAQRVNIVQLICGLGFVVAFVTMAIISLHVLRVAMVGSLTNLAPASQPNDVVAALDAGVYQPIRSLLAFAAPLSAICSLIVAWTTGQKPATDGLEAKEGE